MQATGFRECGLKLECQQAGRDRCMMRPNLILALVMALTWSVSGYSQDESTSRSEIVESEVSEGYLDREVLGIKPLVGAIFLDDSTGDNTSRGAAGFAAELNLIRGSSESMYIGPSTGLIYSHLGASESNFFGTDAPEGNPGAEANFFMIPLNLKWGYLLPSGSVRFSVRGGGNVIYRSVVASTPIGDEELQATNDSWDIYPNVGIDIELGPVLLRPDYTFTPGADVFTAMAGLIIPIG